MALSIQKRKKKRPESFCILVLKETSTLLLLLQLSEAWKEHAEREMKLSYVNLAGKRHLWTSPMPTSTMICQVWLKPELSNPH